MGARRGLRRVGSAVVAVAAIATVVGTGGGAAHASPTVVVVPNANTTVEGNGNNAFPFDCGSGSMRYQQVYAGSQVGSGSISQVAFRDGVFSAKVIPNIRITLSTTTKAVTGLAATFASNIGSDVTTVFSGDLTLSGPTPTSFPGPFDTVIPLQKAFSFNPAGGNLLLDVTEPTCEPTSDVDADFQSTNAAVMARVYAFGSTSTSGQGDSLGQFGGLVTQFTLGPATSSTVTCDRSTNRTISGTSGPIVASTGTTCVSGATVNGSVAVNNGASVVITNSTIHGNLSGSGPGSVTLCNDQIDNDVSISAGTGFLLVGAAGAASCAGNTIGGSVTLHSNGGGLRLAGNSVHGSVSISSNHASGTDPVTSGPAGNVISHNTIVGNLTCSGDVPPASDDSVANSVGGSRSGECAAPTF